jgi:hypothetical protein
MELEALEAINITPRQIKCHCVNETATILMAILVLQKEALATFTIKPIHPTRNCPLLP